MAKYPNTLWLTLVFFSLGAISSKGFIFEEMNLPRTDCKIDIKYGNWSMDCISQNFLHRQSSRFFLIKLRGSLNLTSSLSYKTLLYSTSTNDSEFYSCDSVWRPIIDFDRSSIISQCEKLHSYVEKLILILNETSVKSLRISRVSELHWVLNILSECSHLRSIVITENILPKLSTLPSSPNNSITNICLKDNMIETIADGIFLNFHYLSSLDLSHNLLKNVKKTLFDGATAISELDLSYNFIESLASDVFTNLVSLKVILLKDNNLQHIDDTILKLHNHLSVVDLSNNPLKYLPPTLFRDISSLQNVSCSNCNLLELDKNSFLNTPHLVWLNFSCNNLQVLKADMFKPLKFLKVADFGYNNISYLDENLFGDQPYLEYLNLTNNRIPYLKNEVYKGALNIRFLDLDNNEIKILKDDHIKDFTDLEYFGLRQNNIHTIELGLTTLVRIRRLDISSNKITNFKVRWKQLIFMETFNADNNKLTSIDLPPCIPNIKQTLTFSFKNNKISEVNIDALLADETKAKYDRTMSGCFFNGLAKNFVHLTHNPLLCDCKLFPFYKYARQKSPRRYQLDMLIDKSNLRCSNPPFLRNASLVSLSDDMLSCPLVKDECPESCLCGTRGKDGLIFTNCSSLNLTEAPQIIPAGTTVLYANKNRISNMISLNTDVWRNLSELHLDSNMLTDLYGWKIPPSLRYLSVRRNKLKVLPQKLMEFISNRSEFQLFFGNNNQNCDCDRKGMKKFLLQNLDIVGDNENILCVVTNNGTTELLPLTSIPEKELCPDILDNSYQKRLLISLCVLFTFSIVLMLVYYKERQLILSFFHIHCEDLCQHFYTEEDDDKIFDAFVAYSSSDIEIVLKLLQELEMNSPYFQLCIHERNWMPGRFITDNIVSSVESSRRTIVVLSNTFIMSPWFNLELRAAVFKMSKDKMSRLIVILTDKSVSLDSIDPEIRHVISKRTYLVWGERWFWEKLRYAMPRKKGIKLVSRNSSEIALMPDILHDV